MGSDHRSFKWFWSSGRKSFAAEGARLLLGSRRIDRLETVAAEARRTGAPAAQFHALDVAQLRVSMPSRNGCEV